MENSSYRVRDSAGKEALDELKADTKDDPQKTETARALMHADPDGCVDTEKRNPVQFVGG